MLQTIRKLGVNMVKHPDICIMYYGSNKNNRPSYNAKKRYNW